MQCIQVSIGLKTLLLVCVLWVTSSFVYSNNPTNSLELTLIQVEDVNTYIEFKISPLHQNAAIRLLLTKQDGDILYNDAPIKNMAVGIGYAELQQAIGAGNYEAYLFIDDGRILYRRFLVNQQGVVLIESPQRVITKRNQQNTYRQN